MVSWDHCFPLHLFVVLLTSRVGLQKRMTPGRICLDVLQGANTTTALAAALGDAPQQLFSVSDVRPDTTPW